MTTCTIPNEIHLGDIGTKFSVTVMEGTAVVDLTGFTSVTFWFKKPDKSVVSFTGTVEDAANGLVSYTTLSGDLDQVGRWSLQVAAVLPSWNGRSDIETFKVYANL